MKRKPFLTSGKIPLLLYISIFASAVAFVSAFFSTLAYDIRAKWMYDLEVRHHLDLLAVRVASQLANPMAMGDRAVIESILNNQVAKDFTVNNAMIILEDGSVYYELAESDGSKRNHVSGRSQGEIVARRPIEFKSGLAYGAVVATEKTGELILISEKKYMFERERVGNVAAFAAGLSDSVAEAAEAGDFLRAREMIENMTRSDSNIIYTQMLRDDGTVLLNSERGGSETRARALEGQIKCDEICAKALEVSPRKPVAIQSIAGPDGEPALDIATPVMRRGNRIAILRTGYSLKDLIAERRRTKLLIAAMTFIFIVIGGIISVLMAARISYPIRHMSKVAKRIGEGELDQAVDVRSGGRETFELGQAFNQMIAGLKERQFIKDTFSRYVTSQVAEQLLKNPESVALGGVKHEVTVLFSDIRGFTELSEKLSPEEVVSQLNEYFSEMVDVIFKYEGTLDKFVGDAIMAVFGAPFKRPDDPERAVRTAVEMQDRLRKLNARWISEGRNPLGIGIGINTGDAIAGNIGDIRRMEYTVIGYNVNMASRMENLTKKYSIQIIISDNTYQKVRDIVKVNRMDPVDIKGSPVPVQVYEVVGLV